MADALVITRGISLSLINALIKLGALSVLAAGAVWIGDAIGPWFGVNAWQLIAIWAGCWYVIRNGVYALLPTVAVLSDARRPLHAVLPLLVGVVTVLVTAAAEARGWPLWAAAAVIVATAVAVRIAKLLADVIYDW
ncbi:Uncharacterised protein [Mycobacteroides abscessus subsp. abscessus]|uniref:hypothetical protein n=1 Tax=Mycobacteroides abscessus TaxID=36809 RepID=UPI000929394D|nr:hypothetical protein [Mycobacteroides abscessus]SHU70386.1 Uncharacterised protein [Mycobacteroides abscessus subsp. abscessus]